ncbi:rho GTPase-activating protein gacII-like isoform X1 [Senna tora]|uniref:Rho GTPase-activating protein gacII-like isoform X1 n=1 Tax=Senna tora TaxID=362788 RepID=A0A835C9T6_9FABA|nr:rho GTPase-activating protein gacII-like isoform X1 [Senna tora]
MDSGNSGSMQSSSGGDDDYDSRADSISAFLNHPPTTAHHHLAHAPFSTNPSHPQMFDPLSNYFDPIQRSPSSSLLNLDMVWPGSKPARSEPNPADLGAFMSSNQAFLLGAQSRGAAAAFPTHQSLPPEASSSRGLPSNDQAQAQAQTQVQPNSTNSSSGNVVRNPKKRSRASRRAPTTVLTTDTTNFRAMVQEFTGIPAPPFPSSSPFPRSRLDLFGNNSASPSSTTTLRSAHLADPPLPPYLLRPFPHKLHPPPPFLSPTATTSSSSMPSSFPTTSSMVENTLANPNPNNNDLGPILNFQSILRPASNILAPKSHHHHHQAALEIPPSANNFHHHSILPSSSSHGGAMTTTSSTTMVNGIVNYLASSDFHGEKGTECVVAASAAAAPRSEAADEKLFIMQEVRAYEME